MHTIRRQTPAKKAMLTLFQKNHLLSGPDLVAQLPHIDPSTVYRNLRRFVADGVLKEVSLMGLGTMQYELSHDDHHHFVCRVCGRVESVALDVSRFRSALPRDAEVDEVRLLVRGRCSDCCQK